MDSRTTASADPCAAQRADGRAESGEVPGRTHPNSWREHSTTAGGHERQRTAMCSRGVTFLPLSRGAASRASRRENPRRQRHAGGARARKCPCEDSEVVGEAVGDGCGAPAGSDKASGSCGETQGVSMFQPSIARETEATSAPTEVAAALAGRHVGGDLVDEALRCNGHEGRTPGSRPRKRTREEGRQRHDVGHRRRPTGHTSVWWRGTRKVPADRSTARGVERRQGGETRWRGARTGQPAVDTAGQLVREGLTAS